MRHALDVPFLDAAAADLRWSVGEVGLAPLGLCALRLTHGPLRLELRILGASHAVLVEHADGAAAEVVACDAPGGAGLPPGPAAVEAAGLRFLTTSAVERPGAAALGELAARLRDDEARDPATLLAAFPGREDALTVVRAEPDPAGRGTGWRTWHLYPEAGEVVRTATSATILTDGGPRDERAPVAAEPLPTIGARA